MTDEKTIVIKNERIAEGTWRMVLKGGLCSELKAGQFVNLEIKGHTLRRPVSVSSYDKSGGEYTLLYKVVGEGTEKMAAMKPGEELKVLGPLGNGFPVEKVEKALLVGGGAGTGPLVQLAEELKELGAEVKVVLGFPRAADVYGLSDFRERGIEPLVSTDDGSMGFHGNAMQLIEAEGIAAEMEAGGALRKTYACGPVPMLKAVSQRFTEGYISLDIRMACGMGACMACVCKDKTNEDKYYRVCKEGPVFPIGQVEL